MANILLYIGIALIIIGWVTLSWFAAKQLRAQKEYERLPQKWNEVKQSLIHKRFIGRTIIILGLILILISLLI
ncbi:MAG: hypothetical protein NC207_07245 [Bacteroides sp.]|nr:hypothetical protein [Bacteroides sp.]